jgi:hypothetical protein
MRNVLGVFAFVGVMTVFGFGDIVGSRVDTKL